MNELFAFLLGYLTKALLAVLVGKVVAWIFSDLDLKNCPRVIHYLRDHEGRSPDCHECSLGHAGNIDGIS